MSDSAPTIQTTCVLCREPEGMQEYQRMAAHFGRDLSTMQQELHRMRVATHEQVENIEITREVRERMSVRREYHTDTPKAPDFLVGLRSHTVWEKTPVKLFCTVAGSPTPIVKWFEYKNNVPIDPLSAPGKYKIEKKYGVHGLIISRYGHLGNKHFNILKHNVYKILLLTTTVNKNICFLLAKMALPLLSGIHRSKLEVTLLDRFGVTFGTEGESLTLVATMVVVPDLPNLPPEALWYRDDTLLKPSRWVEMSVGGGAAKLTFPHLNKDDEGLYTLRIWTKDGTTEHSAYLFVKDAAPSVVGAPGSPMDVTVSDVNKDYVLVSWKPPNTTNEPLITGYFVDRRKSGTKDWVQCNGSPVKVCKLPVDGLTEGASYHFRVRAVNSAGISLPSRMSSGVTAAEVESDVEGRPPTEVHATEINRAYVVLSWKPPSLRGRAPLWYLIEKSEGNSNLWQRVNTGVQIRSPRYAIFDLDVKKACRFRIIAVNKYGPSEPSEPSDLIQKVDPHGVPSAPGQVIASRNTKTSAFVQWDPPKNLSNLMGYYVDCCVVGSKVWTPCNHRPYKHTRFVVHGLIPGETYIFRVQAVNAYGLSEESQESAPLFIDAALKRGVDYAAPSAPYGITLLSCDGSSMTLAWKRPKNTGGTRITSYYVDKREAGSLNWKEVSHSPATSRVYKVENLTAGVFYEFKVQAGNLAGVGLPSEPSKAFACEEWTMPEPGPTYDLSFWEVRDHSLLLQWRAPVYSGASPVTGYFVEMAKKGSSDFVTVNAEPVTHCYLKITGLETGAWYVFKVRAVNVAGKGKASDVSDAVYIKEIECGVDEETGDIFLSFEASEISEHSKFTWSKSYKEISESNRASVSTVGRRSRLTFVNPDKEDLGIYSVAVSDTDGLSSSHTITEEGMVLLELSYNIRHPIVPLKTELNYEVLEKGHVRFWLQVQKMSSAASYRFIVNDKEVTSGEGHKISHNASTGLIQMTIEHFTRANEGTYTLQIHDGKAKNQSSLVLVGDGESLYTGELSLASEYCVLVAGSSASELMLQCTPEGIRLQCYMKYYTEEMKTSWFHKESKIASSEKMRIGGTSEMAWMQICEPTDKEKGHYSIEIHDGKSSHTRSFDLSGQVHGTGMCIHLPKCLFSLSSVDRGRVVGGLPDVVTIMEYKTLSLTCTVWGDPKPEVTWFKNEQEVLSDDHNQISFESGKFASLTIKNVTVEDSGKYSINVRNKYGGEFVEITVSVYKQGEPIPEPKLGQMARPTPIPTSQAPPSKPQTPAPSVKAPTRTQIWVYSLPTLEENAKQIVIIALVSKFVFVCVILAKLKI
uniref:Myomesin 2a n=1 Tax=Pygocentrus nattereri TaxID=42514 RepID=A0AAR2LFY6_PYGNA